MGTGVSEYKIVFTGPMGAGKTTAIDALSESAPIRTDVASYDQSESAKATTTVGLDYGRLQLDDETVLKLYGTPGQKRFDFLWRPLANGALGVIILLDAMRPDIAGDLQIYAENFDNLVRDGFAVVGVGRADMLGDALAAANIERLQKLIGAKSKAPIPVIAVDVRKATQVRLLVEMLMMQVELYKTADEAQ